MNNMHAFGQTGVDLYTDGAYRSTAIADEDAKPGKTYEHVYFRESPRSWREVTLYLALYKPVKVLSVGVDREAHLEKAGAFALSGPVVFYGTSITQGGCASRPGMSYQAILGRVLNIDFVNLGFPEMEKASRQWPTRSRKSTPPASYSISRRTTARWLRCGKCTRHFSIGCGRPMRTRDPGHHTDLFDAGGLWRIGERRDARAYPASGQPADRRWRSEPATGGRDRPVGLLAERWTGGRHPSKRLGFQWMAEGLAPRLRRMLKISG